jgi:hypothetical protein
MALRQFMTQKSIVIKEPASGGSTRKMPDNYE